MRYRYRLEERRERRLGFVRLIRRLALLALFAIVVYLIYLYTGGRPQLTEESLKELSYLPASKRVNIETTLPVETVELYIEEEGRTVEIHSSKFSPPVKSFPIDVNARSLGLKEGKTNLKLSLSSGFLRSKEYTIPVIIDLTPPKIEVVSYTQNLQQGGTGAIKVKSEKDVELQLYVGEKSYSFYPLDDTYSFTLFPVALEQGPETALYIKARDKAGNQTSQPIKVNIKPYKPKVEKIELKEEFINSLIYSLLGEEGRGLDPVEAFKRVNEVWRSKDASVLLELGKKSEPKMLWEGPFLQLPNSKVISTYGDVRFYIYKGQQVSESRHMGYDFASLSKAPIPASNSGVVVFARPLGIYGNAVVIDHGFGLMSLYGHLSEIHVKEGQFVKKGETIGRTGTTGLALGDHLHFGVLVQGYEVNPVEWLDSRWIEKRIVPVMQAK